MTNDITDQIPRTCANCACHSIQENKENPLESQMFCQKDPPMAQKMRVDMPQMRDGKVVMMKDGKTPITRQVEQIFYMYKPTMGNLVCFDGWRPMGTQPGQRSMDSLDGMTGALKRLWADMIEQQQVDALRPGPGDFGEPTQCHIGRDGGNHDGKESDCTICNPAG